MIADYHNNGFLPVRGLVDHVTAGRLRQQLDELLTVLSPTHPYWQKDIVPLSVLSPRRNPGIEAASLAAVPFIIGNLPVLLPGIFSAAIGEPVKTLATTLLGSNNIEFNFANVTRKPAHIGPNMAWHRDHPNQYICPRNADDFLRILIALDPVTPANGALQVIPGSHRNNEGDCKLMSQTDELVSLAMEPGDAIALHPSTCHGGPENRSDVDRNLVIVQISRAGVEYDYNEAELYTGVNMDAIRHAQTRRPGV
ncbi:MAG: phytanoyl-CoA dioxygenase family protein [Gammaproteobacteria bacterium]|nr:phytanoyl-CoA dioxygenase family protein [Gammaproteobacteria bacterium]